MYKVALVIERSTKLFIKIELVITSWVKSYQINTLLHCLWLVCSKSISNVVMRDISEYHLTPVILISFHTVGLLHGDMSQGSRNEIITKFKKKEFPILVATDVAGM